VDDRDPHGDAGYVQGVVEASTLTLTALDVMTCFDFFKSGCNDNGFGEDKGSNPRYIKSIARSVSECVMSMLDSPGKRPLIARRRTTIGVVGN